MTSRKSGQVAQIPMNLPHEAGFSRADFVTGRANREALDIVDGWPDWPEPGVLLVGPGGSGKSHLAAIWRSMSGANGIAGAALSERDADRLAATGAIVVEDLHIGPIDEAALFHLINAARERKAALLLTSRLGSGQLGLRLPDLVSRLRASRLASLHEPDDELLRSVMTKLFADRQIAIDPAVIEFLLVRMERSLAAANHLVAALDQTALARNSAITKRLAGEVISDFEARQNNLWDDPEPREPHR